MVIFEQCKPQAHELELRVSLPEELMPWRRIIVPAEVSSDLCNERDRITQ